MHAPYSDRVPIALADAANPHPRNPRRGGLPVRGTDRAERRAFITAVVLTLATILLATLAKPFIDVPGLVNAAAHHQRSLDLMMFNGFDHPKVWWAPWTNTLGNIALFIPVGLLAGPRLRTALLAGGGLSLGIEVTQYILALGYTDIDDLVCNTLGAGIGAAACAKLNRGATYAVLTFLGAAACTFGAVGLVMGRL